MAQMKMQMDYNEKLSNAMAKRDKEMADLQFKYNELAIKTRLEYDKLETESNTDIEGEGTE